MRFAVISSGSKANCTYLEYNNRAILIDCGLSCKQAIIRLEKLGVDVNKISAILLTHEHSDHIRGLSVLSRKLQIPVYANFKTSKYLQNVYATELFTTGEDFSLGSFSVHPFSIVHDAVDPVGFSVRAAGIKFAQVTDLGRVTSLVKESLKDSNMLVLEFNYDQQRLMDCDKYPWELKQRIQSSHGHLSNNDASMFLNEITHPDLRHVVLAHLSENSNEPELALAAAAEFNELGKYESFLCGSVERSTEIMTA